MFQHISFNRLALPKFSTSNDKKNKRFRHYVHYIPLYRNTQHYATFNCSIKRVNAQKAHKSLLCRKIILNIKK